MRASKLGFVAVGILGAASAAVSVAAAGEGTSDDVVAFAEPVQIKAGDKILGEGRLYPSPVLHDVDGDGTAEMLIGDLRGMITVAKRTKDGFGPEKPLLAADGKQLKFHNW